MLESCLVHNESHGLFFSSLVLHNIDARIKKRKMQSWGGSSQVTCDTIPYDGDIINIISMQ